MRPEWEKRLRRLFHSYLWNEFSKPHRELWEWVYNGGAEKPFVAIWPRSRGKSSNVEILAADWGARNIKTYIMYVSGTQSQADKHVQTIARMLASDSMRREHPAVGKPRIGQNGGRTWNRSMVTTSNGFTVEAVGLNKAVRGQKIDWARPDAIIFDDVDEEHDSQKTIKKKREIITKSILPAASSDNCSILFCQNLLGENTIAHELSIPVSDGGANYLADRVISGPHPAVENLEYELVGNRWEITKGKSLWHGYTLEDCENEINRVGPRAYEIESQHNVERDAPNALLSSAIFEKTRVNKHPVLDVIVVGVDPSGGHGRCGVIAGGVYTKPDGTKNGYTIDDNSTPYGTDAAEWGEAVLWCYHRNKADYIVVERNFGGDMAINTIKQAVIKKDGENVLRGKNVKFVEVNASRGKKVRAQPIAAKFQRGLIHHVGYYPALEKEWATWIPGDTESPDKLDAEVWVYTDLLLDEEQKKRVASWRPR